MYNNDMKSNIFQSFILSIFFVIPFLSGLSFVTAKTTTPIVIKFIAAHGPIILVKKPLTAFKTEVEKNSKSRIKVEITFANADDYNIQANKENFEKLENNDFQMSQVYASSLAKYEPNFMVLEVPFIFEDYEHSFATVDGEIGKQLFASLEAKSPIKGLGYTYCGGYRFIATKDKQIKTLADFKGLKIASGTHASTIILEKLGTQNQQYLDKIAIREAVTAGELDGLVTVFPRFIKGDEQNIATTVNEFYFNMQFTVIAINKNFFGTLSAANQKIIETAVQNAATMERALAIDIAQSVIKNSKSSKLSVVKMAGTDLAQIKQELQKTDWAKEFSISKELIESVKGLAPAKISGR